MIEHLFCFVNDRCRGSRVQSGGQAVARAAVCRQKSPEIDATIQAARASQMQARPCCVPGGPRPLLAADSLTAVFADPAPCSAVSNGPTRPRRQCAAGPRTLFPIQVEWPCRCSVSCRPKLANSSPRSVRPRLRPILSLAAGLWTSVRARAGAVTVDSRSETGSTSEPALRPLRLARFGLRRGGAARRRVKLPNTRPRAARQDSESFPGVPASDSCTNWHLAPRRLDSNRLQLGPIPHPPIFDRNERRESSRRRLHPRL